MRVLCPCLSQVFPVRGIIGKSAWSLLQEHQGHMDRSRVSERGGHRRGHVAKDRGCVAKLSPLISLAPHLCMSGSIPQCDTAQRSSVKAGRAVSCLFLLPLWSFFLPSILFHCLCYSWILCCSPGVMLSDEFCLAWWWRAYFIQLSFCEI